MTDVALSPSLHEAEGEISAPAMGSKLDAVNVHLTSQAMGSAWKGNMPPEDAMTANDPAMVAGLIVANLKPQTELEGMLIAQLVACHNASMECFRRAMLGGQTTEGRDFNLTQANKLTRSYATLLQTLDKHRGKGQQTVRVEHVHVHKGGQAIVGSIGGPGPDGPPQIWKAAAPEAIGYASDVPVQWETLAEAVEIGALGGSRER